MSKKTYCGVSINSMGGFGDTPDCSDESDCKDTEQGGCSSGEDEGEQSDKECSMDASTQHSDPRASTSSISNNPAMANRGSMAHKRKLTSEEKEEEYKDKMWASFKKRKAGGADKRILEDKEYPTYTYMKQLGIDELFYVEELGYGITPFQGRALVATIADNEKCVFHVPMNKTYSEELIDRWCIKKERHIWLVYNGMKMSGKYQRQCHSLSFMSGKEPSGSKVRKVNFKDVEALKSGKVGHAFAPFMQLYLPAFIPVQTVVPLGHARLRSYAEHQNLITIGRRAALDATNNSLSQALLDMDNETSVVVGTTTASSIATNITSIGRWHNSYTRRLMERQRHNHIRDFSNAL